MEALKQLHYCPILQRRKPRLRIVGSVSGIQLVRDRAMLLVLPPGAARSSHGHARKGSPCSCKTCTLGYWLGPFNYTVLGELWPALYIPGPVLNATGDKIV